MIDLIIIDYIIKLVKAITDGAGFQQKNKQDLYNNFVVPALTNFENLHQNYVTTFKKYLDMFEKEDVSTNGLDKLSREVELDSLLSGNLRAKIYALENYIYDEVLGDLAATILNYFSPSYSEHYSIKKIQQAMIKKHLDEADPETRVKLKQAIHRATNVVRSLISDEIQNFRLSDNDALTKKTELCETIKFIINTLQERYTDVMNEFEKMGIKLLR